MSVYKASIFLLVSAFSFIASDFVAYASTPLAELSANPWEITAELKSLSGNTGGVAITGGKLKWNFIEANVMSFYSVLSAGIGYRQDFEADSFLVPHLFVGSKIIPSPQPNFGVGLEILTPGISFIFNRLRFGFRIDQYVYLDTGTGEISPLVTLGVVCHL